MKIKKIIIIDALILLIGGIGILLFYLISHIETKKPSENPLLLNNLTIKDKYLIKDKQYVFTTENKSIFKFATLEFSNEKLKKIEVNEYYHFKIDGENIYFLPTISIKEIFYKSKIEESLYIENNTYLIFTFQYENTLTTFEFNILDYKINF